MTMTKEYRAELKQLRAAERKIIRDQNRHDRETKKAVLKLHRENVGATNRTQRELRKIGQRMSILQGRLS